MTRESMDCGVLRARLAATPEGRDDPAIQAHLEGCAPCRAWASGVARLAAQAAQLRVTPSEGDTDVALRLARRARERVRSAPRFPRWGWPALSASLSTAAAILVIGLSTVGSSRRVPSQTTSPQTRTTSPSTSPSRSQGTARPIQSLASWLLPPRPSATVSLPTDLQQLDRRASFRPRTGRTGGR